METLSNESCEVVTVRAPEFIYNSASTSAVNAKPEEPKVVIIDNGRNPLPLVITNTTTVIREVEEQKLNYVVVIAVVSTIIGVIVIGGLIGYCLFYRKNQKLTVSTESSE